MRKTLPAAALMTVAILILACAESEGQNAGAGTTSECQPLNVPDIDRTGDIMHAAGFDVSRETASDGRAALVWRLDGSNATISVGAGGTNLNVAFRLGGTASENAVNSWNDDQEFARTYLDRDGSPVLEMDLDFEGGICEDNVRAFFRTSASRYGHWKLNVPGK
ncbi:MAG: YbjN domain-containing protein [Deltaproteobacteria bacterium]|nr:YbjN domain-containing protein [Deltaproteobacteria bacterium]